MPLTLRLFGEIEVSPMRARSSQKARWALAILALRRGRAVERAWLAGMLWPDTSEAQARYNLRRELTQLRRALGEEAWRLRADAQTLGFDLDGAEVDVLAFDAAARACDPRALELYRGPLMGECDESWVLAEREARRRAFLATVGTLAEQALARREPATAVSWLRAAVALEPLDEGLTRALMRSLAACGSHAAALTSYRELRVRLERDLQVEPAPETRAVAHALRRDGGRFDLRAPGVVPQVSTPRQAARVEPSLRRHLPRPLTDLVGRDTAIAEVAARLGDHRLVTLTGSGGVGKSSLAMAVANALEPTLGDGVAFIELGRLAEPALLMATVAQALGVPEAAGQLLDERVDRAVAERELLIVLDDCDPLIADCAALAARLLRVGSSVRVLATSRQSLAVSGELVWRVPSLSDLDATVLFRQRATGGPAADATVVTRICRRLDGIPLAIELAAARTRALTVEQIDARLDDRLRLLTGGSRTGLPRHGTLRAALDWSHQLLDPAEREVLAELSVFAGGSTLESAASVHGGDPLDALDRLVDRSLVGFDGRYRLLETVRAYAHERLREQGRLDALRMRHLDHFTALAEAAEPLIALGASDDTWMARLDDEADNLRAALATALASRPEIAPRLVAALSWYWFDRGRLREACSAIEAVIPIVRERGGIDPRVTAKALAAAGWVALWSREFPRSLPYFEESLRVAREVGEPRLIAQALSGCGVLLTNFGDYREARRLFDEAEGLGEDGGDTNLQVFVQLLLARAILLDGDAATAEDRLRAAGMRARDAGLRTATGNCLLALGQLAHARGEHRAAWSRFNECALLLRAMDHCGRSRLLAASGRLALDQGRARQGAYLLGAAEALYEATGVSLFTPERPDLATVVGEQSDAAELERSWSDGYRLGAERAVDELLRCAREEAPPTPVGATRADGRVLSA